MFMMYVDLDELPTLFENHSLWSVNKPNLASFYRNDHYGDQKSDLSETIRNLVANNSNRKAEGPIRLLTHFRYFGYVFNPLSIYYCYDANDEKVTHIVSEVSNTPWNEQHCYVLNGLTEDNQFITRHHKKEFHVSPFLDMNMEYHWSIGIPSDELNLSINNKRDGDIVLNAAMNLKREELNSQSLSRILVNFPLMTMKVTGAIYLQALKLWLKGMKYMPHPKDIKAK
jgi:DUF1365 family protein